MKILLIDQLAVQQHIKYIQVWIKLLEELNFEFDIITKKNILDNLKIKNKNKLNLDNYSRSINSSNFFIRKIKLFRLLINISRKINFKEYDYIIFLSFDNITMFLSFWLKGTKFLLILHNNLRHIDNCIIKFLFNKLGKRNTLITLDDYIYDGLKKRKIDSKRILHPLLEIKDEVTRLKLNDEIIIFSPSITSIDEKLIKNIIENKVIQEILVKKNIKLILRTKLKSPKLKNIILLNDSYLKDYDKIFLKAKIIFLPYSKDFKLRISGVLLESLYLGKGIILPRYNDLSYFLKFNVGTSTIKGFEKIDDLINILENIDELLITPDYKKLRQKYSEEEMKKDIIKVLK